MVRPGFSSPHVRNGSRRSMSARFTANRLALSYFASAESGGSLRMADRISEDTGELRLGRSAQGVSLPRDRLLEACRFA